MCWKGNHWSEEGEEGEGRAVARRRLQLSTRKAGSTWKERSTAEREST